MRELNIFTYLSKYYEEEDNVFVMYLSPNPVSELHLPNMTVQIDSSNRVCKLSMKRPIPHNDMLWELNENEASFLEIDMLPLYKLKRVKEPCVVVHIESSTLFTFGGKYEEHTK